MAMQLSRLEILGTAYCRSQRTVSSARLSTGCFSPMSCSTAALQLPQKWPCSFRKCNNSVMIRAVEEDRTQEVIDGTGVTNTDDQDQTETGDDDAATPNYAIWILSLVSVIGIFYALVFYAGTGLVYLLTKRIQFKKKEFVPYSVKLERERREMRTLVAPPVLDTTDNGSKTEDITD